MFPPPPGSFLGPLFLYVPPMWRFFYFEEWTNANYDDIIYPKVDPLTKENGHVENAVQAHVPVSLRPPRW